MTKSIITIARMNPPTFGHLKLIQTMMNYALQNNLNKIYLILSSTKDKKNPLMCEKKRDLLINKNMIQSIKDSNPALKDIDVIVICMKDVVDDKCGKHVILKHICTIIKLDNTSQFELFIGEDRATSYSFINTYLQKNYKNISINNHILSRTEITSSNSQITSDNISASFMRSLAVSNNKELFISLSQKAGLSLENSEELFIELQNQLIPKPKIKTSKTTKSASKTTAKSASKRTAKSTSASKRTAKSSSKRTAKSTSASNTSAKSKTNNNTLMANKLLNKAKSRKRKRRK